MTQKTEHRERVPLVHPRKPLNNRSNSVTSANFPTLLPIRFPMPTPLLAFRNLRDIVSGSTFLPTMAVLLGILASLLLIGFWIRARFFDNASENSADPEQLLGLYEEMRRQGDLTDEEFRSIKNRILPSRSHVVENDT